MSAPASLPVFGDAYLADTQHLTLEEHGAYFKLLLCAWRLTPCELPADDKRIATMLGVSAGKWAKLKPVILAFWTRTETGWQQKRLTKERKFVEEKSSKNRANIEAYWEAKRLKTNNTDDTNDNTNDNTPPPPPLKEKKEEEKNQPTAVKKSDTPAAKRGSRLTQDFTMPDDWISWAVADRGWMQLEAIEEAAAFTDYWHAKAGANALKLDWQATWRNWCRNSKRTGNAGRSRPMGGTGQPLRGNAARSNAIRDLVAEAYANEAENPGESVGDYRGAWAALPGVKH